MRKFAWGQVVKDKVTGFTGAVLGYTEYATGCVHYGLCPLKLTDKNNVAEWSWFDGSRLKTTKKKIIDIGGEVSSWTIKTKLLSGGPSPKPPSVN